MSRVESIINNTINGSYSGERSFSKLGLVKTRYSPTMVNHRLGHTITATIDFSTVIKSFVQKKSRRTFKCYLNYDYLFNYKKPLF